MSKNSAIEKVWYPGLIDHPQHEYSSKHFTNFGGLLSFSLKDIDATSFLDRLKLIVTCSSLGDTRTLAIPPATTIFHDLLPRDREAMDIPDGMVRLSVGIEDADELLADIVQAI